MAAIAAAGGMGVPTVKPWNLDTIRRKIELVKAAGAFAVAMDVDAAGLPFLKNMTPPAGSKTVDELKEIAGMAGVPFIVKGVMTGGDHRGSRRKNQSICRRRHSQRYRYF